MRFVIIETTQEKREKNCETLWYSVKLCGKIVLCNNLLLLGCLF